MKSYLYENELFCESCGKMLCRTLKLDPEIDKGDVYTFEDDELHSTIPEHCAAGAVCINAITLPSRRKAGAWLGNSLTARGEKFVRDNVEMGHDLADVWAECYRYLFT